MNKKIPSTTGVVWLQKVMEDWRCNESRTKSKCQDTGPGMIWSYPKDAIWLILWQSKCYGYPNNLPRKRREHKLSLTMQ